MVKKKPKILTPTEEAIAIITNKYGAGAIQQGRGTFVPCEAIPIGVANIDVATGCGGIPRQRITEIYGNESSGKTTLCLQTMASCQAHGWTAAFIDAEHALDLDWAQANGVNIDKLLISQPDSGDEALNIVETLVDAKSVDLIIIDSVAALVPQEELDGDVGDSHIGAQARLLSQAMRKLVGKAKKSNSAILFVNQIREKIGVRFGSPETTPGGRALKFYSSMRMEVRRQGNLVVNKTKVYGVLSRVKVVKNKVAPPFLSAEFEIHFGQPFQVPTPRRGIYREQALLDGAISVGALRVSGSHYYRGDETKSLANGKDSMVTILVDNTELRDEIVRDTYKLLSGFRTPKDNEAEDSTAEDNAAEEDFNQGE